MSVISQFKKEAAWKSAYFPGRTEASQKRGCANWVLRINQDLPVEKLGRTFQAHYV